ncbi:hypothetical protein LPJ61_004605, partial [Coemansia biformis]
MLKIRTVLLYVGLACLGLLTFTAIQHRDEFSDRSLTNYENEDTGMFRNILNMADVWQGDTHVVMGKMVNETL